MSRQYDDFISDKFELFGEMYKLIEPNNLGELLDAFEVKSKIQEGINCLMHDEDTRYLENLMQDQENYIREYIDNSETFNNDILIKNIMFLLKKNGLKMGDLEKILGISAGYISRTAKENSSKKMSIDIVWKIAELFDVNVDKLINYDLSELNGNIGMLVQFLEKLKLQTACVDIEWDNLGGVHSETDERFEMLEQLEKTEDGKILYSVPERSSSVKFYLADDIMSTYGVDEYKELLIIPFKQENSTDIHYDFIFSWNTINSDKCAWEKIFYTYDEPFGTLDCYAEHLYNEVKEHFLDVPVSLEMRMFISGYLGKQQ